MNIVHKIHAWYRHALTPATALQSFTALLKVRPHRHEELARRLAQLGAAPSATGASVRGLHHLHCTLFTPSENASKRAPDTQRALLLSLVFEGEIDDVLAELMLGVRDDLLAALRECEGFVSEFADPTAYLKRRVVPRGSMLRLPEPLGPERDGARHADATLQEIHSAAKVLDDFAGFCAKHPPPADARDSEPLMQAFLKQFDRPLPQLPLHPLEERQPEEDRWVRLASELMQRKQRRVTRQMNDGLVRRAAHAKASGLVRAKFRICKSGHAVGLFQRDGEVFDAVVRASSSAESVNADRKRDARGIAISVDLSAVSGRWLGHVGRQDFLLFSHPVFVAPNVQRLVRLLSLTDIRDRRRLVWHALRFVSSRGGIQQLWHLVRSLMSRPRHPLAPTFHSAVPYQLGRDHVVKYSVQPSDPASIGLSGDTASDDFSSAALERSLAKGISLDFFVHVLPAKGENEKRSKQLRRAVEDATLDWSRLGAKRVKVATIEIGGQSDGAAARALEAERWAFNPWNALEEHRPLGSINRARRTAYRDGANIRGVTSETPPRPQRATALEADRGPDSEAAE